MNYNLATYAEQAGAKVTVNAPAKYVDQSFINEAIKELKRK
jgi:hypothetical protein